MSIRSKTLRTTNYWKEILTESETISKREKFEYNKDISHST